MYVYDSLSPYPTIVKVEILLEHLCSEFEPSPNVID